MYGLIMCLAIEHMQEFTIAEKCFLKLQKETHYTYT